jgi:hypothetical protein
LFDAATRIVPIAPTLCARTTGAAADVGDGVAVGVAAAGGEAVPAVPVLVPPHAASITTVNGTATADRLKLLNRAVTRVATAAGYG